MVKVESNLEQAACITEKTSYLSISKHLLQKPDDPSSSPGTQEKTEEESRLYKIDFDIRTQAMGAYTYKHTPIRIAFLMFYI